MPADLFTENRAARLDNAKCTHTQQSHKRILKVTDRLLIIGCWLIISLQD